MNTSTCKKCNGLMKDGVALENTYTGIPDFPGNSIVTLSVGGPGRLVNVEKCGYCGWSVSKVGANNENSKN